MAIAERRLAAEFNRPGHEIVDHWTYAICSDGDLQEGIASEAASLAGHLRLGKLAMLYDDNQIQLDGPTAMAFSEDVLARFRAYGWHTLRVKDGTDVGAIEAAIRLARSDDRPSIIAVRTVIGYGSPNKAGSQKAHGAPLGPDEVRLTKEAYGWDPEKTFYVPDPVAAIFSRAILYGEDLAGRWNAAFERYRAAFPAEADAFERRLDGDLAAGWDAALPRWEAGAEVATRNASADAINALAAGVPELFGGSADLSESNLTDVKGGGDFTADAAGRNLRFGVREHGMGGIANGIAYHGGLRPYAATFLTFSDYMRGSVRVAALSGLPVVYVWTHDSVGLGEDGPTHQPVEHYAALRAIPGPVVRPAGRRQRDGGRLGARPRADRRADGPRPDPPEAPRPVRHRPRPLARASAAAATWSARRRPRPRAARPTSSTSPPAPRSSWPSPRPRPWRPRGSPRASSRSPAGRPSTPRTPAYREARPAGRRAEARCRRDRRVARLGALGRRRGGDRRPRPLRHLRPGGHDPARVRVHRRGGRRRRAPRRPRGLPRPGRGPARAAPGRCPLMRVAFAADHGGAELKAELLARLADTGHELIDLGGDGSDPNDDYPDFARRLAHAIRDGEADRGILVCGSGIGASVAANKVRGVRAAIAHDTYSARQGVEHDDMNVLCLGGRVIGPEPARRVRPGLPGGALLRPGTPRPAPGQGPRDRGRGRLSGGGGG